MSTDQLYIRANDIKQRHWPLLSLPALIFITDEKTVPDPCKIISTTHHPLLVIIRDYDHQNREHYASQIAATCHKHNMSFLVADNPLLAKKLNATGIHLPEYHTQLAKKIRESCPNWIITSACHRSTDIQKVNEQPLDALLLSPLFTTKSHPDQPNLDEHGFNTISNQSHHPCYALGGINSKDKLPKISLKSCGIAGISCFKKTLLH